MKTYLLDSFNRFKRFSEELDVKTILCNKSWWIFNDCGDKEIYIFQENNTLIISINGNVTNASWKYIQTNRSLIITNKELSYMLHPAFLNDKIFALQKDGTEQYSFMILEEQLNDFHPKTLLDLMLYFVEEENKREKALLEIKILKSLSSNRENLTSSTCQKEINNSYPTKKALIVFYLGLIILILVLYIMQVVWG